MTGEVIDTWDKWVKVWPEVPWQEVLDTINSNLDDSTIINPMIDKLQEHGVEYHMAVSFVCKAFY